RSATLQPANEAAHLLEPRLARIEQRDERRRDRDMEAEPEQQQEADRQHLAAHALRESGHGAPPASDTSIAKVSSPLPGSRTTGAVKTGLRKTGASASRAMRPEALGA